MKNNTIQRNNTGFPGRIDSPYYMEKLILSALTKHVFK